MPQLYSIGVISTYLIKFLRNAILQIEIAESFDESAGVMINPVLIQLQASTIFLNEIVAPMFPLVAISCIRE